MFMFSGWSRSYLQEQKWILEYWLLQEVQTVHHSTWTTWMCSSLHRNRLQHYEIWGSLTGVFEDGSFLGCGGTFYIFKNQHNTLIKIQYSRWQNALHVRCQLQHISAPRCLLQVFCWFLKIQNMSDGIYLGRWFAKFGRIVVREFSWWHDWQDEGSIVLSNVWNYLHNTSSHPRRLPSAR